MTKSPTDEILIPKECVSQLIMPYDYVQSGDLVELREGDQTAFRLFTGAAGRAYDFAYPIYRVDWLKLIKLRKDGFFTGELVEIKE